MGANECSYVSELLHLFLQENRLHHPRILQYLNMWYLHKLYHHEYQHSQGFVFSKAALLIYEECTQFIHALYYDIYIYIQGQIQEVGKGRGGICVGMLCNGKALMV